MNQTIKIHDCSDNSTAPPHRDISGGPRRNDIMSDLQKYAASFSFEYVDKWREAEVIITNTTFPLDIWNSGKLKVKRMDGVYWRDDGVSRNIVLNAAAARADLLIFISEYSLRAFYSLYPKQYSLLEDSLLKKKVVIRNNVDNNLFYNKRVDDSHGPKFIWATACSNWDRPEKRLNEIIKFAEFLKLNDELLILIGKINTKGVPSNVEAVGYVEDYWTLNTLLNQADGFVNFSFRDAGCKCVSQAVNAGLPVLYANSGGVPELVGLYGAGIPDYDIVNCPSFMNSTPGLIFEEVVRGYYQYKHLYNRFIDFRVPHNYLRDTIGKYFSEIRKIVDK